MAIGKFLKASGLAALAAGLALAAVPAAAQDGQGRGGWRGGDRGGQAQASGGGERRGGGEARGRGGSDSGGAPAWRGRQQSAPQAAAPSAPQAAPQARQSWQGRGGDGQRGNWQRGDNDRGQGWRGQRQVQVPRNGVEQRQAQAREAQARDPNWSGRNRTYVDPNRNATYRADRDRRGDNRNDWRDGNRRPAWEGSARNDRRWDNDRRDNNWRDNNRRWDNDRRGDRRWNNAWRNDSRYDWQRYRYSNRNVYRLGRYYAPYRNYYYRPLSIGFRLDSLFFGSSYWINDPWQYRLPPAEYGYRWVRYYDDVLLVDTYTGEVVDVIRDFFW